MTKRFNIVKAIFSMFDIWAIKYLHIDATSRIYQHFDRYQNLHINQYIQIYHYEIIGDILIMIRIFYVKEKTKKTPKNGNNIYKYKQFCSRNI